MAESFPLDWPIGYKKTVNKKSSAFRDTSPDKVQTLLRAELKRLGASNIIISSNAPLRRDGSVYAEYLSKKIEDSGIAVYFNYKGKPVVLCCDSFYYPWENMLALARGVEAMRKLSRYGISEFIDRAFTGFKAIPENVNQRHWFDVLGVKSSCTEQDIKSAYRKLAQIHHPDAGGSVTMFDRITKAYQEGLRSI